MGISCKLGFFNPPISESTTYAEKVAAGLTYSTIGYFSDKTLYYELVRVDVVFDSSGEGYPEDMNVRWYNVDTGELLKNDYINQGAPIHTASSYLSQHSTGFIDRAGNYKARVTAPGYTTPVNDLFFAMEFREGWPQVLVPSFSIPSFTAVQTGTLLPFQVAYNFRVDNNTAGTGVTNVDISLYLLNSTGLTIVSTGWPGIPINNSSYYVTNTTRTYDNLAVGYYTVKLQVKKPYTTELYADKVITNAIQVTGAAPPAPTLWEQFLNLIGLNNLIDVFLAITQPAYNAINTVFKAMTGRDVTDSDAATIKAHLPGLNGYSVLAWGKALNDEARNIPTELEVLEIIALATAISALPVAIEAIGTKLAVAPAAGSAEAYLQKYFLTATAESAPAAGSLEKLILQYSADAGVIATPVVRTKLLTLGTVFGTVKSLKIMKWAAMALGGEALIATWLASDNIITGSTFPMNRLKEMIEAGTITKEAALLEIDKIQYWKNYATTFVSASTILNPFLWLFRKLYMINTELAQLNIDQIKTQIQAAVPPAQAPTNGTLSLTISPTGVTVYIAGHPEITQAGTYTLLAGTYTILATKTGYYDKSTTAYINAGETTYISLTLTESPVTPPVTEQATLLIDSSPQGAKIYIDGAYKYVVTPFTIKLDPASYVIRLELSGYSTSEGTVTLTSGQLKTYDIHLAAISQPPITDTQWDLRPGAGANGTSNLGIIDTTVYHSSPSSIRLDPSEYCDGDRSIWENTRHTITAGQTIKVSAWVRFKKLSETAYFWVAPEYAGSLAGYGTLDKRTSAWANRGGARLGVDFRNSADSVFDFDMRIADWTLSQNTWYYLEMTYTAPAGTVSALVWCQGFEYNAQASVWFDDVTFSIVGAEQPPTPTAPEEEVTIPLVPAEAVYDKWRVTIQAVDKTTRTELYASVMLEGEYTGYYTPRWFDWEPNTTHNITLRKTDYKEAARVYTTGAITDFTVAHEATITLEMESAVTTYNAWKVTIKAVDAVTNDPLNASILIDDVYTNNYTPWYFYLAPESTFNIKLRKTGYYQAELDYTTKPLPT